MEMFDLFDNNRLPLGKQIARGTKVGVAGENRQVVHICIFNSEGKFLIQRRDINKDVWPGYWDISAGGSAKAGETTAQAASRELAEELGIKYDFSKIRPSFTINFINGFDDFYFIKKDFKMDEFNFTDGEVKEVRWASCEDILEMIDNKKFIPFYKSFIMFLFEAQGSYGCIR